MNQRTLSRWLKGTIVGVGLCGLLLYLGVLPASLWALSERAPEFLDGRLSWMILIWVTALPCYAVLGIAWRISKNIGADRSFSRDNARLLQWVAALAAADAVLFFAGNLVYLFLGMNRACGVLCALLVGCFGAAISVASAALSHLVQRAAALQEENDLTI